MPLDEEYSFDFGVNNKSVSETLDDKIATLESDLKRTKNKIETLDCDFETKEELEIVQLIKRKSIYHTKRNSTKGQVFH